MTSHLPPKPGGRQVAAARGSFTGRTSPDGPEVPVHQAPGVIAYDPARQAYAFDSWTAAGQGGKRELKLRDDGWQREIQLPQGTIRYVMTLTPAGEWHEVGERSSDGTTWQPFFQMTLKKTS